jgi:hypothetical protein
MNIVKVAMRTIRDKFWALPATLAVTGVLVVAACSSDTPQPSQTTPGTLGGATGHAIHVFAVSRDGSRHQLDFGPGTELSSPKPVSSGDLKTQGVTAQASDAGPPTVGSPGSNIDSTAWALLERAAMYCNSLTQHCSGFVCGGHFPGYEYGTVGNVPWQSMPGQGTVNGTVPTIWNWFIFGNGATPNPVSQASCSDRLQLEENLLCAADQLGAIADAVGTTVWPALGGAWGQANPDAGTFVYTDDSGAQLQADAGAASGSLISDEWDIPPQSDSDRFIVRDLAIHTLGMLATLDATPVATCPTAANSPASGPLTTCTCASLFGDVAEVQSNGSATTTPVSPYPLSIDGSTNGNQWSTNVFGVGSNQCGTNVCFPNYPPSAVPIIDPTTGASNAPAIARSALQIEGQILRSGGRLLHDLVRRDVYADLAAAAQQGAQQVDPTSGNPAAWGKGQGGPYGTYAHAVRVLTGRWEIGDTVGDFNGHGDPACEGVNAINLLTGSTTATSITAPSQPSAFGDELTARIEDVQIRTKGQALAASLVAQTGIVLPSCSIKNAATLRGILAAQLQIEAQTQNQDPTIPLAPFTQAVAGLQDSEILFGFQYGLRTYRLLTNTADPSENGGPCAALPITAGLSSVDPKAIAPGITGASGLQGIVIQGGIDRSRLKTEAIAQSGGLLEASECPNGYNNGWSAWGTTTIAPPAYLNPGNEELLPTETFQDAFHIGQSLERRLVQLGIAATPVAGTDSGDPESVARGAVAELRAWAGSMLVQASGNLLSGNVTVTISGANYSDFGLTGSETAAVKQTAIMNAFGFVYGPPWVAECAAQIRTDCPTGFNDPVSGWVQKATAASDQAPDSTGLVNVNYLYGAIPPYLVLTVPYSSGTVTQFQPPQSAVNAPSNSHLYMVRLSNPTNPTTQGQVLGVIRPYITVFGGNIPQLHSVSFAVAPMQRELLEDTIDLGKWIGAKPPGIGDLTAADSPGYCVDGVARDVFVPLQNQLTAGSTGTTFENSWQYYLGVAQQASQTADDLAKQLLNLDLQITQNEQAAGEAVAGLCGDYGALAQTSVTSTGQVVPNPSDQTLTACLTTQTTDVVFLGPVPSALSSSTDPTGWIKQNVLQCGSAAGATDQNCSKSSLTYDSFKLVPNQQGVGPSQACTQLQNVIGSRPKGFTGTAFRSIVGDPLFGSSSMAALASSLKMNVNLWNDWQVTYAGTPIMDSTSSSLWPGCLRGNTCSSTGTPALLNTAFRYCPGVTDQTQLLTTALGCDPGSGSAPAAELNMLKWRVAGALWMIAASAGDMPPQMFNMPVPVVLLPAADGHGGSLSVFIGAGYNGQTLVGAGTATNPTNTADLPLAGYTVQASQGVASSGDSTTLGTIYQIPSTWSAFTGSSANEIPSWYSSLYSSAALAYTKHAQTSNTELPWINCDAGPAVGLSGVCPIDGQGQPQLPYDPLPISFAQLLDAGAWTLDGMACSAPFGTPATGDPTGPTGVGFTELISAFKTGYDFTPYFNFTPGSTGPDLTPACAFNGFGSSNGLPPVTCSGSDWLLPGNFALWQMSGAVAPVTNPAWSTSQMPPWQRAFAFANLTAENGPCNALSQIVDAAAVACATQAQGLQGIATAAPPPVNTVAGMAAMEGWLDMMGQVVSLSAQGLYAEEIPTRVVSDFQNGQIGTGDKSGTYGTDILNMETALQDLPTQWTNISTDFHQISLAIDTARLAIEAARLGDQDALTGIAIHEIQTEGDMAQATLSFESAIVKDMGAIFTCASSGDCVGAVFSFANIGIASNATSQSLSTGNQLLAQYGQQVNQAKQTQELQVAQALATLNTATGPLWANIQASLDSLRKDVLAVMAAASDLQLTQNKASYEAAVASGADLVTFAGQEVPIPLNTVLNRQASATQVRYQTALKNAKALAYMARRAIEQRIGIPLSALTSPVGPLDPPAAWADDVCSLTGVNYQQLSTATAADAGGQGSAADQAVITQFSNQFVGDYVAKLSNFVNYFNVQYPSHQGDDTAILSLRYDLMNAVPQCSQLAPNLLLNSGRLDALLNPATTPPRQQGWRLSPCPPTSTKCLAVISGSVLQPPDGPAGAPQSPLQGGADAGLVTSVAGLVSSVGDTGVTWLTDTSQTPAAGVSGGGDAGVSASPPGLVYQAVSLASGSYLLSWFDEARDPKTGALLAAPATAESYVVRVFDAQWNQLAMYDNAPFVATSSVSWSARLALPFTAPAQGTYYIAFGASTADEPAGSVAIADVQLEATTGNNVPSPYIETSNSRMVTAYNCTPSDSDMRSAFKHDCDSNGNCWYDLVTPIIIDSTQLQTGQSPISGKLAPGNYNFRHVNLALNLVGTNVHDCSASPTPDCYGSAYIQYTLRHDGTQAGILDWNGNSRVFDFGVASINYGKALAAERYITLPMSSNDQGLISQPGVQHIELGGRPLDGVYSLRIWDSPSLKWSNLQDVQIVLAYEYWSEIVANGNSQTQGQ